MKFRLQSRNCNRTRRGSKMVFLTSQKCSELWQTRRRRLRNWEGNTVLKYYEDSEEASQDEKAVTEEQKSPDCHEFRPPQGPHMYIYYHLLSDPGGLCKSAGFVITQSWKIQSSNDTPEPKLEGQILR